MNVVTEKKVYTRAVGICLGASTISLVEIEEPDNSEITIKNVIIRAHEGDPKTAVAEILDGYDLDETYLAVTGRKFREILDVPFITEPEATEIAFEFVNRDNKPYDAIVSAGGETFIVYEMDKKGKISQVSAGNKCASGTGEFFLQQIRRMNINIEQAIELSKTSKDPHVLSGRCSVFCKSDCTHALNKGVSVADVTAGLARMIAKKIEELLVKVNAKRIMIVGGTARNDVVVSFVRENFEYVDVPAEAPNFEALGAALWALAVKQDEIPPKGRYFKEVKSVFTFLSPLSEYTGMVDFKQMPGQSACEGDECILGLDVGSTTTKAVLFRISDEKILASVYLRTNGNPIEASRNCYRAIHEQLQGKNVIIKGLGVTGSGRYISGLHADTEGVINEIIAHARAAAHFDPEVDTIFEIGGQDAKYTYLTNAVASDYAMNEACSAGTGSFLEESAFESLGVKMEDIAPIALKATRPPNFSDQCAAFISSDIKTAFQEGIGRDDIIAGLVYSICLNYLNRVKGSRQVGNKIFMQGGVCYNKAVPVAMAALSGKNIIVPPEPGLMGAYGVALEIKNMLEIGLLKEQAFDLKELAERSFTYGKSFICPGTSENCDRKCEIAVIEVAGKKFPFGGACNKYYNFIHKLKFDVAQHNHVATRIPLLYNKFAEPRNDLKADAPVIGINRSFHTNTLYPFYYNFFTALGCKVVLPDTPRQSGIDKGLTSFCLSGQIALGMFEDLLLKKPDYIFMPQLIEMHVSEEKDYRKEFQTVCMFVQGEFCYQKATFLRNVTDGPKMITPPLNFMRGYDTQEEIFVQVARELGFSTEQGKRAHRIGFEKQMEFFRAMKEEGRRILAELEKDPTKTAIVLFGRPYNAFADETNKGVPNKFASRGITIIPYDFLSYEDEDNYKGTYWEMGQRIIKAARIVKRHPQLFGTYLTNFLCALDSMMIPHFRDLMGTKPSLTIEVDSHTADAGVNTRIEAFMDVIKNYLKVKDTITESVSDFVPARTRVDTAGKHWFIDSNGEQWRYDDANVKAVVPSMGDLFAEGAAGALRSIGWQAEALPVCNREALDLGRSVTTGKECLPIINIVGELLYYLKYRKNRNEKLVLIMVAAGGCCRVGQYAILLNTVIEKYQIKDVTLVTLANDDGYAGFGVPFRINILKLLYAGDVMDDIRSAIKALALNKEQGMRIFREEWEKIIASVDGTAKIGFYRQLRASTRVLSRIKLAKPIREAKYVGVVGEIFVRRDHFCLTGIPDILADNGFVMLDAHVSEWLRYVDYLQDIKMYEAKITFMGHIELMLSRVLQNYHEKKIKKILARTGLYEFELLHIRKYMEHSKHFFPVTLTGEPGLSSGAALYHLVDKYCGVINIGPFGCMNSRMTESTATPEMTVEGKELASRKAGIKKDLSELKTHMDILPFLSIESDGNPFSQILQSRLETFMLQANRLHEYMQKLGLRK